MSHFEYGVSDISDDDTWVRAMAANQRGGTESLRTSQMVNDYAQQGITTYTVSDVLQGSGIYKPTGIVYDRYNQSLSADLSAVVRVGGGAATVLGVGRTQLLPFDVLTQELFKDARWDVEGSPSGGFGSGGSGAPPPPGAGPPTGPTTTEAAALLANPNCQFQKGNGSQERKDFADGKISPNVIFAFSVLCQQFIIWISSTSVTTKSGHSANSLHYSGRAVDIGDAQDISTGVKSGLSGRDDVVMKMINLLVSIAPPRRPTGIGCPGFDPNLSGTFVDAPNHIHVGHNDWG